MGQDDARKQKAAQFVRRYSQAVAQDLPNNSVAQALNDYENEQIAINKGEADGLMRGFQKWLFSDKSEGNEQYVQLHQECAEVIQVWMKFQEDYPHIGVMMPGSQGPPSVAILKETVDSAIETWKTRREEGLGKARRNFQEFSETILAFSDIFSVIPQGDKYISLFTGIVSTVIKASARTHQIAEGFSRALVDITKDMNFSKKQFKIHQGPEMQALIAQLYMKYLKFFCYCMTWFSSRWKRIVTSLKQDFYNDEVQTRVDEIKSVVEEINRQAHLETDLRVHEQPTIAEFRDLLRELFPNISSRPSQVVEQSHNVVVLNREELQELFRLEFGRVASQTVANDVEASMYNREYTQMTSNDVRPQLALESTATPRGDEASSSGTLQKRKELEQLARPLQSCFPKPDMSEYFTGEFARRQVHAQIVTRLQTWIETGKSERLWIMSAPGPATMTEGSIAARHVEAIAQAGRLPCVSYSCRREAISGQQDGSDSTPEVFHSAMLCGMLCSMVWQLTALLPAEFDEAFDLQNPILSLGTDPKRIPLALDILSALLKHAPTLLIVVLDGLEHVADEKTQPFIDELFDILWPGDSEKSMRVSKILLSSQGFFPSGGRLGINERLDCTNFLRLRPGKAGGRRSIAAVTVQDRLSTTEPRSGPQYQS